MPWVSHSLSRSMSRLRTVLARRPWIYWLFVVAVAASVALTVSNALAEVRRERSTWGRTGTVHVAVGDIDPGDRIAPSVETRTVPVAVIPPAAVTSVDAVDTARQRVGTGEIIVALDVGPAPGPLAMLPDGWLAVAVDDLAPTVFNPNVFTAGDHAVVLAAGATIAADAVILDVTADAVLIGVPADVAPAVAEMVAQRLAVIALSGR